MKLQLYRQIVQGQFDAALAMTDDCLRRCPTKHWDGIIGKYPFWHVAYHALCYVDLYAAKSNELWKPHTFHPKGMLELSNEYPSRRFEKPELRSYVEYCRNVVTQSLSAETEKSLVGPSGFSWVKLPRAELPIYSLRHLQHHAGQLGAFLRLQKVGTRWVFGQTQPQPEPAE